jgi:hypothetical protein
MNHKWVESSGTSDTCANCGCIRVRGFSSALPYSPTAYATWDAEDGRWTEPWDRYVRTEPPCLTERSASAPDWIRETRQTPGASSADGQPPKDR